MKKKIVTMLSAILVGASIFATSASANTYTEANHILVGNPIIQHDTESLIWSYSLLDPTDWRCQIDLGGGHRMSVINTWVEDDGKWYYLDDNGDMMKDTLITQNDKYGVTKTLYVGSDGALLTNTRIEFNGVIYFIDEAGNCTRVR